MKNLKTLVKSSKVFVYLWVGPHKVFVRLETRNALIPTPQSHKTSCLEANFMLYPLIKKQL